MAKKIQTHLEKPTAANSAVAAEGKEKQLLKPTALQMDASGRPISEHEYRLLNGSAVACNDWSKWLKHTSDKHHKDALGKSVLLAAVTDLWDTFFFHPTPTPSAKIRKNGKIMCGTTKEVNKKELVVTLFFGSYSSLLGEDTRW